MILILKELELVSKLGFHLLDYRPERFMQSKGGSKFEKFSCNLKVILTIDGEDITSALGWNGKVIAKN